MASSCTKHCVSVDCKREQQVLVQCVAGVCININYYALVNGVRIAGYQRLNVVRKYLSDEYEETRRRMSSRICAVVAVISVHLSSVCSI